MGAASSGSSAPGAARLVRVRVLGTRAGTADINAMAEADDDGYGPNNSAGVQLRVDNVVDLAVRWRRADRASKTRASTGR